MEGIMLKEELYINTLRICCDKIRNNMFEIGENLLPYPSDENGAYFDKDISKFYFLDQGNWTTSFFTGMSIIEYISNKNYDTLKWLYKFAEDYKNKVTVNQDETMHDLGFLYSLYSCLLYEITGDNQMLEMSIAAADVLCKRYIPKCGIIQAWGRMDKKPHKHANADFIANIERENLQNEGMVIIDSMMNMPLLFWVSEKTGRPFYRNIAISHLDKMLETMIREDFSVYHAYQFDIKTGKPISGANYCGFEKESHWARGTSWAIYGLALAYRYTKEERYRETYKNIAHKFIDCLQEEDKIPVWDFRLPKIEPAKACGKKANWDERVEDNKKYNRDTSAAAVAICGFIELPLDERIKNATEILLNNLCKKYFNPDINTPGILKSQNGQNTYTCFGDYYFVEALAKLTLDDAKILKY
jgi:unsaturated chondroitin disaccharide hydrolase